jgi:hypothetical protein
VLHIATGGHGHRVDPGRVSKDLDEDFDDDDDAPRSRWRLSLGKRKS